MPRLVAGLVARPRLFALLARGARGPVTLVSAPAGSGKTMLVSSWLRTAEVDGAVAWVAVDRGETDATRFWGTVIDALRRSGAVAPDHPLATLVPAPMGGQEEFLPRLVAGLGRLPRDVLLVIDDLHQLRSDDALRDLEELLSRAPAQLRTIVLTRRDPPLGLHRQRLAGELTEIRAADLGFTAAEAAELLAGAGIEIAPGDLDRLHGRTEGWAAGLRLAAMSLARHAEPERFVAEFSGSERTVAEYLLGEVLALQPAEVRRLLLRTCILERVNGELADLLTGRRDGTRLLHELEESNALVVAVDVARTWFRYHHLLADLLRLELRREAPAEIAGLHRLAAGWFADHGHLVDAVQHAQRGEDWALAAELLGRHWVHLILDGEETTLAALLAGLPADLVERDAELATIAAADRLAQLRWMDADALIATAQHAIAHVPAARRDRSETALATVQLFRARRLGGLDSVLEEASAMLHADNVDGAPAGVELQALALMNLGIAETWTLRLADAEPHLERALALGLEAGRPYLEVGCLSALGVVANLTHRLDLAEERLRAAIGIAERVGWSTHPMIAAAYVALGAVLIDRGLFDEGEEWLARAEPILADAPEPAATVGLCHAQGLVAIWRGRLDEALAAFREGERMTEQLRAPHFLAIVERQWQLRAQVALGEHEAVRAALAGADGSALWCNLRARLHLAEDDPAAATAAVAPVLSGEAFVYHPNFETEALVLDAVAATRLGEPEAAERSLERALALAEPHGRVCIFLTVPGVREAVEAHPVHRTAHAGHLRTLLDHVAGVHPTSSAEPAGDLPEPLSDRELAVLRFLPTNLSAGEIGSELFLSVHTVKTHMRKLYAKLDVHTRADAVQRGRALGLLAPARRGG
ncbi:MAG TPA: LuxR C-terminal-related transcriptional regulator [Solirubrobacteraceae bacterium]|nr:LuxR C-terminal-related transcriptional regulator [Solirubrobacteraceae bacterium]